MTRFSILAPTCASGPSTICGPIENLFSTVLDGCKHVNIPWHRKQSASVTVQPLEIFSFSTIPGPGSEWASFGLARYPAEIEVTYRPRDDDRFIKTIKKGGFDPLAVRLEAVGAVAGSNGHDRWEFPEDEKFQQKRKIKTRLGSGWRYWTFCKTQYASDAECGGIPNFVRCHLCVIHLLDRIAPIADDEGRD